ncbi:unnamed protein product [Brassica napus]|uniref:(rape) hypothetical protein n=1 Tax=Brassica napus TaxID=3708 RepID=A0A816PTJ6_BRANA|nr:unnamed protein product [Brassica napus]
MDARDDNEDPMEAKEEENINESIMEMQDDQQMEENNNQDEEMQAVDTRSESCVSLSDDEEQLLMGHDDESDLEKPLSEEEIDELISELVGVESKAAEAQKAIEEESLAKVEGEVREKLARTLRGLDKSVSAEMMTFKDVREETLDNLEIKSANLLEQLSGAGVELPKLYKMIESQVPSRLYTEAWKKRAHWVGTQVTEETVESLANAESFLQTHRPVRKRHGELLEEGASGFLEKKFADDGVKESQAGPSELDWSSLNKVFTEKKDEAVSFGSKNWASVYSASTPQQAAAMGLEFPGVNEVEEIEEIDADLEGTFFADAMENERVLAQTEEQKKNYTRAREEDDINIDLQLRLNQKRRKTRSKQVIRHTAENSDDESACLYENNTVPNPAEDQVKCLETSTQFQNNEDDKEESMNLSNSDVDEMVPVTESYAEDSQNTSTKQKVGCCSDKLMENLLQLHNPNWISSLHEHETFLKENEEENPTMEEKDMAWEVYRRALEWKGVQRVAPELQKPLPSPQTVTPRLPKRFNRSRFVIRNCTRTAHQRTLISQGSKVGSSTVCGECGLVLTWEDVTTPAPKIDYF